MKYALLAIAVLVAAGLAGCEGDPSAPNHTLRDNSNPLVPANEQQNAEKRALEKPGRDLPTGGNGSEFPGQTMAKAGHPSIAAANQKAGQNSIATLDVSSFNPFAAFKAPPRAPAHNLAVAGTGMVIEANWGTVSALPSYPHRAWPNISTEYRSGDIKDNSLYFENLTQLLSGAENNNYDIGRVPYCPFYDAMDIPWFYGNIMALPALMVIDPPLDQRTTSVHWQRRVFMGYLPAAGDIAPTPIPGTIHWEYPKSKSYSTAPATQP